LHACAIFFIFLQDEQIRREKVTYRIDGGCAALVALFLGKRLYVANAGDCRLDKLLGLTDRKKLGVEIMVSSTSLVNIIELPVSITRTHCHCDSVSLVWFYS